MGDNNLNSRSNTQIIQPADVNQYRTALNENLVPRNSSGVATDLAGGLGSSLLRWATSYIRDIYIGAFASTLRIREGSGGDAGKLLLEAGAATRPVKVEATGLDGTTIKDASIPASALVTTARRMKLLATITASGDYVVPAGITAIMPEVWAGGGGGGGTTNTGGGAGGGSSRSIDLWVPVTPGETLTATIGAGGAGNAGANGSPGGDSRLARSGATIAYANGGEAGGGNTSTALVAGTSNGISNYVYRFGGGLGGAVGNNGGVGTVSIPSGSSGGSGGISAGGANPAGGGGGGAGYTSGANGGNGGLAGSSAAANSGAGGGGAGGRSSGPNLSGGSGGSGIILIWAVE